MKTKYERMTKVEKKELYKEYKLEKKEFAKKMEKMYLLCYVGMLYGVLLFIYDFFYKKSMLGYILDIIIFIFCLLTFVKIYLTKKELLNNYALKKDKERKKAIVKKYAKRN